VGHKPVYLTEEQLAEIQTLQNSIDAIVADSDLPQSAKDAAVAALEEEIEEITASAPEGKPPTPCPVCNPHTHCAECGNPVDSNGDTTVAGGSFLPEDNNAA